jgi:hypothetical protein
VSTPELLDLIDRTLAEWGTDQPEPEASATASEPEAE